MKVGTLDCFTFICDYVASIIDTALVLRQLVLRDLFLNLKMSPWAASNYQYWEKYVDFFVEIKSWVKKVVRGKEKEYMK